MNDENNKVAHMAAAHVMRFIRNDCDKCHEDFVSLEVCDRTDQEIEFAFTLERDRYYLRLRHEDLRRLLKATAP